MLKRLVSGAVLVAALELAPATVAIARDATRFMVELEDGSVAQLERSLPAGDWRVWRIDTL